MSSSAMRDVLCRSAHERPIWAVLERTAMCWISRRCARRSVGCQYAIHVRAVARATQRGRDRRIPQLACDTRQRAELLLAAGAFRKQQQRNDIDGLAIDGVVVDRFLEASE